MNTIILPFYALQTTSFILSRQKLLPVALKEMAK
jgi:hypothetical protein